MKEFKFKFQEVGEKPVYFSLGDLMFATEAYEKTIGLDRVKECLELTSKNPSTDKRITLCGKENKK